MLKTQPTPSEGTNKLIALAQGLLNGEEVAEELQSALSAQIAIVSSELDLVPQRANERGEAFLEEYSEIYSALLTQMNLYFEGLLEMAAFFENGSDNPEFIEVGVERLLEVTGDLVTVQMAYGQAFSGFGPSRFPVVNTLDRLLTEYRKSDEVEEELKHVVGMMRDTFQKRLDTVPDDEVGVEDVRSGCKAAIECLSQVLATYTDHETHENHVKTLGEALFELETAAEEDRLELLEGPSSMPAANILINISRRALAGKTPKEDVGSALQNYIEHVTNNWDMVESQLEKPIDSATIQEELPNTLELVDAHEDLMDRMVAIYEDDFDPEKFEACIEELIELVGEFQESAQVFVEAGSKVGKLVCVNCGRANPQANNVCEECGHAMPKIVSDEQNVSTIDISEHGGLEDDGTRMVMTTNLERIFKACDDLHEGNITPEEFVATLEWAAGLLHQMRQGLGQLEAQIASFGPESEDDPKAQAEKQSLMEVGAYFDEGLDEWEAGLEEMARYLEDPVPHHLRSGKKRVWEGASAIHRCRVIGDAAQERLKELEGEGAE